MYCCVIPGARVLFAGDTAIDCRAATAVVFAVAALLDALGSVVVELSDAVLLMTVPPGVVAPSLTSSEMLTVAPGSTMPTLQVTVVVPEHDPAAGVTETNVVFAGTTSVIDTFGAFDGPLFVTGMAYVMFVPSVAVAGAILDTPTSAAVVTVVVAVAVLLAAFGSAVADATAAEFATAVPLAALGLTRTTKVKVAEAPFAKEPVVAVTFPVPPTGGVVVVQPAGALIETNVVLAGTASVSDASAALAGPAFVAVIV